MGDRMPRYLAKYTIRAMMFDGAWMQDPEAHHAEHKYIAENDAAAVKIAEDHKKAVGSNYFGPRVTLDQLLKIEEVEIKEEEKFIIFSSSTTKNSSQHSQS